MRKEDSTIAYVEHTTKDNPAGTPLVSISGGLRSSGEFKMAPVVSLFHGGSNLFSCQETGVDVGCWVTPGSWIRSRENYLRHHTNRNKTTRKQSTLPVAKSLSTDASLQWYSPKLSVGIGTLRPYCIKDA